MIDENDGDLAKRIRTALERQWDTREIPGLYRYTQIEMGFHSNAIEGGTVSMANTESLFDSGFVTDSDNPARSNDIIEMENHFAAFRFLLDTLREDLSEGIVRQFHCILKRGTEDEARGYAVGAYKQRENVIGGQVTCPASEVPAAMKKLFRSYRNMKKDLSSIAAFHAMLEIIHPFQDGNGRVGRLVLFRECLFHGIMPFIVHRGSQLSYMACLRDFQQSITGKGLLPLTDLFESEQSAYVKKAAELCPGIFNARKVD